MKQLPRFVLLAPSLVAAVLACGPAAMKPPVTESHQEGCGGLGGEACGRARGLLAAATSFSNVEHAYLLDPTSSFAPGRALVRADAGMWSALPSACAKPQAPDGGKVDATTVDFGFVGVSIDSILLSADADVSPMFSAGASAPIAQSSTRGSARCRPPWPGPRAPPTSR